MRWVRLKAKLDNIPTVFDLPSADLGESSGEDIGGPFVAEHHGVLGGEFVLGHCLGELGTHGLFRPPDTGDIDRFAEFLHHFFATVVADDDDRNTGRFAIFNPFD